MKKIFTLIAALVVTMGAMAQTWDFTAAVAQTPGEGGNLSGAYNADPSAWGSIYNSGETTEAGPLMVSATEEYAPTAGITFGAFGGNKYVLHRFYPVEYGGSHFYANKDITMTIPAAEGSKVTFVATSTKEKSITLGETVGAVKVSSSSSNVTAYEGVVFENVSANPTFKVPSAVYIQSITVEAATAAEPKVELVGDNGTVVLAEGVNVESATQIVVTCPEEVGYVTGTLNLMKTDIGFDGEPFEFEEEIMSFGGKAVTTDGKTWTISLMPSPYYFQKGEKYYLVVSAWPGDENTFWEYECKYRVEANFYGTSETPNAEPTAELDMSFGELTLTGKNENYEVVASSWEGAELSFPYNNVEKALAGTDVLEYGALQLKVVEGYLCHFNTQTYEWDLENPVAKETNATGEDYDAVTLFKNVQLEPDQYYAIVIPQRGVRLINMMEYGWDDTTMDGVLWTNSGEWDQIVEVFKTAEDATNGIKSVENTNAKAVMYNLAGQRVNNAKGIVIVNGKKYVQK